MSFLLSILAAAVINVIPAPAEVKPGDGEFQLRFFTCIKAESPEAAEVARTVAPKLRKASGRILPVRRHRGRIELRLDPACGIPDEGYRLSVTTDGVCALASGRAGLFYALQTLLQMTDGKRIPCADISDAPRFAWRGFHIDPVRHFLSPDAIRKQIDILSEYKINTMHWHLTDDQGWRIEIKKHPRLTEVGAWRTEFDGSVHGGFYTQEEVRSLVDYAARRCVTIVPEIEMPGHAFAAVCSYPELSCRGEQFRTLYTWGSPHDVFCVGSEKVYEFLDDVISEVAGLFPGEYIHIGGDECHKDVWEQCPICQERIRELGLEADAEFTAGEKLQSYAVHRMEEILARHGKKLIGWDEILQGGLSPGAAVMSWRGEEGGKKAALSGHYVVMTPGSGGMYFDHYQGDPKIEPVTIGGRSTLEKVYSYDPVPDVLRENGKDGFVKGVQCNNWAEYMYSESQREYMLFPRAFALAEIAWTRPERKDFDSFLTRCDLACKRLDALGVNYHIPLPEQPDGSCNSLAFSDSCTVELGTTRPLRIVFTTDGSEPSADSPEYSEPLTFTDDAVLKAASVLPWGRLSPVRTIRLRKMSPMPAMRPEDVFGLRARRTEGRFISAGDIPAGAVWTPVELSALGEAGKLEPYDNKLPDSTRFYAAEAEGCFRVPETGTFRFSSDCDRVWIDGQLLIDNGGAVKRSSHNDAELVLEAGAHNYKVLFIYNVIGGWISLRSRCDVLFRQPGSESWTSVAGDSARLID